MRGRTGRPLDGMIEKPTPDDESTTMRRLTTSPDEAATMRALDAAARACRVPSAQAAAGTKTGEGAYPNKSGGVAERFKAPVLKTGDGASHP